MDFLVWFIVIFVIILILQSHTYQKYSGYIKEK